MLLLLYEFMFDHLFMLMFVFMVETLLRAVVCANFVAKAILIRQHIDNEKLVRRFQIVYYLLVFSVLVLLLVMSLFSDSKITCDEAIFSYHWFILDFLDLLQSLLITVSALYLFRHMK